MQLSTCIPWANGLVDAVEYVKGKSLGFDALTLLIGQPAVSQGLIHQLLSLT